MGTDKPKPPLTQWEWSGTVPAISLRCACVYVNLRGPLCLRICRKLAPGHTVLLGLQLLPIPRGKAWGCLNFLVHQIVWAIMKRIKGVYVQSRHTY